MTIAENLKKQRGNMTQTELAKISGVSQKTISAIEVGRIEFPTYQTAIKLAEALECEPSEFLKGKLKIQSPKKKQSDKLLALKAKLGGK